MFSYVDLNIRTGLESDGKLITIDISGDIVDFSDSKAHISILGPVPIPRSFGKEEKTLDWYCFVRRTELSLVVEAGKRTAEGESEAFRKLVDSTMSVNSIFALPGLLEAEEPLIRLHSCCLTGDIFGSMRCDCGPQLNEAFQQISSHGSGAVVYMSGHEGRGIGLWAKAITYILQDSGQDTYQANASLGLPDDCREFGDAAVVLKFLLRGNPIKLLSNNPDKKRQLEENGQKVSNSVALVAGVSKYNKRYLKAKKSKGHSFDDFEE